jgi:hypothetical protein
VPNPDTGRHGPPHEPCHGAGYLQAKNARWLGPLLIGACLALRFGWGGLAGPPVPFWQIAYLIGAAGIVLCYVAYLG